MRQQKFNKGIAAQADNMTKQGKDDVTAATTAMHHRYLRSLRPFRHKIMSSCDLSTMCHELS
jgi:hypothetical protein